jgi:hypothetical protein
MKLYLVELEDPYGDVHISRPRNARNFASYIAIAKWKTSSRIRRVRARGLREDSDRFRFTSETVERLAPNFNVTELYKSREKVGLFAQNYP